MTRPKPAEVLELLDVKTFANTLPLGNQPDPLDELFFIILTTMTQYGAIEAYTNAKELFGDWTALLDPGAEDKLRKVIAICGLVNQKAPQIVAIARQLQSDFGHVTLDPLRTMTDQEAESYLLSLPRVGKKVARCVLMYSLGRNVLPVDAHVLRVSQRLGLLQAGTSWAKAHDAIHERVEPELRYGLHVGLVQLGRDICMHKSPRCDLCSLCAICPSSTIQPGEAPIPQTPSVRRRRRVSWPKT